MASSALVKLCGESAFSKFKRSMTTPNIINEIGDIFENTFQKNDTKLIHNSETDHIESPPKKLTENEKKKKNFEFKELEFVN